MIIDILTQIVYHTGRDAIKLMMVNKEFKEIIGNLNIKMALMPAFRNYQLSEYFDHYRSFITGEYFQDQPIWLFQDKSDPYGISIDGRYVRQDYTINDRQFIEYDINYQFIPFQTTSVHWANLNKEQRYIVWAAIRGVHPEIRLEKCFKSDDLLVMLHEVYRHYLFSFSRQYLEIYYISPTISLASSKFIALEEIEADFIDGHPVIDEIYKLNIGSLYRYPVNNINYRNHTRANVTIPNYAIGREEFLTIINDIYEKMACFEADGINLADFVVESTCLDNHELNKFDIENFKLTARLALEHG